ncbi:hypothetical protein [Piscinibacter koreensis]|uniref:hypothetical protein n=1 Tax=Piscinibacter koreensis TaxID=2742824 RepID=UPI003158B3D5
MTPFVLLVAATFGGAALAKLPPPTPEAKAKTDETAARTAWSDKVAAYQLCQSMDRTAEAYRARVRSIGKEAPPAEATPPCTDPGPFSYTPPSAKPLEASEAHSPAGNATSPPSTPAHAVDVTGPKRSP